jgi:hypothetical protein
MPSRYPPPPELPPAYHAAAVTRLRAAARAARESHESREARDARLAPRCPYARLEVSPRGAGVHYAGKEPGSVYDVWHLVSDDGRILSKGHLAPGMGPDGTADERGALMFRVWRDEMAAWMAQHTRRCADCAARLVPADLPDTARRGLRLA